MKLKLRLFVGIMVMLLVSACSGKDNSAVQVAVAVALTQTAAAPALAPQAATAQATATAVPQVSATQAAAAPQSDVVWIQFEPNSTSWHTNGDVSPKTARHFVLSAFKEQQMTISLITEPAWSDTHMTAAVSLAGANGEVFIHSPQTSWGGVLPATQDYYIDVVSMSDQPVQYALGIEISAIQPTSSAPSMYEPISKSICDTIMTTTIDALENNFEQSPSAPFTDPVSGETGDGCLLSGGMTGTSEFSSAGAIVDRLVQKFGFTEQPAYRADGPTGAFAGATRGVVLMLIEVKWQPTENAQCPADQPVASCNLTPQQKLFLIKINIAQYKAGFSLDGHWEAASTNFSLDLYQDWKNIYGHHTVVAQNGSKIDTLDVSINGSLQGKVATVQFKSSFTNDTGTAQIIYIDVNTIQWKIIKPPAGEYYLPAEATLTRK